MVSPEFKANMMVYNTLQYLEDINGFRDAIGVQLNLSPVEEMMLEDALSNYDRTWSLFNNCTDPVEELLNLKDSISPWGTAESLSPDPRVLNAIYYRATRAKTGSRITEAINRVDSPWAKYIWNRIQKELCE